MHRQITTQINQASGSQPESLQNIMLQKKCACGQHTVAGGECESCRKKRLKLQQWRKDKAGPALYSEMPHLAGSTASTLLQSHFGQNFSQVQLHTRRPIIQRQPRGEEAVASEPIAEATNQPIAEATPVPQVTAPTSEPATPEPTPAEPTTESAETGETAVSGLLVEDEATELGEGQMRKSEFMAELRTAVCAAAEAALSGTDRTAEGCPYLDYWFDFYAQRDVAHGERVLRRYAPETANATTARGYIPIVAERVRQGVARWASTGELSGVPEGVPTAVPGEPPAETDQSNGAVQFKAREGGVQSSDDPAAIRDQLGNGRSLDSGVRSRMESAFGTSFSHVRMHNDSNAANLSSSQNARAFTVGEHVAFGAGEYQPDSPLGDALIAHELAHVVQQSDATESVANMQVDDAGYDALERDADRTAVGAITSLWDTTKGELARIGQNAVPHLRSGLRLQRCKDDKSAPTNKVPTKTPTPSAKPNCSTAFNGVTFALANQKGSGANPAADIKIVQAGGKSALTMRGIAPAKYEPKITITAPTNAKAQEYEVGIIQNVLSTKREHDFSSGSKMSISLPTPLKDGAPKASGMYDDDFAENGKGHPNILVPFTKNGDKATLKLPDTPGEGVFVKLQDNKICAGVGKAAETLTKSVVNDKFRTWVGVRHKSTKCVKTIHHIDWHTKWIATVNGTATPPSVNVTSNVINVTTADGNGSPSYVRGGKVPADLVATARKCK